MRLPSSTLGGFLALGLASGLAIGVAGCGGASGSPARSASLAGVSGHSKPGSEASAGPSRSSGVASSSATTSSVARTGVQTITQTTATSSEASTPATTTPAPDGGAGLAAAPCTNAQITVSIDNLGEGMSHGGVVLIFHNGSGASCTIGGYPGVAGLSGSGAQVTQAVREPSGYLGGLAAGTDRPPEITLAPGQDASATAQGTSTPEDGATSCPTLHGMLVTPPNTTESTRVDAAPPDCSGLIVTPVVRGSTGVAS